ncbi:DUF1479 domain protein [Dichotomocladium elegans]|nr:DUF1479 domain protein [Dichotomocladium elegans]
MHRSVTKAKGNISSVFAQLGASRPEVDHARFLELKKSIVPKDTDVLRRAFDRLLERFETEASEIRSRGPDIVPQVSMEDIRANGGRIPEKLVPEVKKRGVVVIKNLVDPQVAAGYKESIQEYLRRHPNEVAGFPEDNPQVWELYWSRAQVEARSHPNFIYSTQAINRLWHSNSDTAPIDLTKNLTYCDRLRIRLPGDSKFALGGHVDGGSLERWEDPEYRACYTKILEGKWEEYDPYDVTHRITANMDLYNAPGGCSMFRLFQGWMAMSNIATGGGTLRACPLIKESTAYFMMKPLLGANLNKSEFMGAWPGRCQDITVADHPHIVDTMVSMPDVQAGDAVFWHCDTVHAVESTNAMKSDSSVLYIPSTPMCPKSSQYLLRQRLAFEKGLTPPDFPENHCEEHFDDRVKPSDLNEIQKLGMGFLPYPEDESNLTPGQLTAIREHNRIIASV